MLVLLPPSEGKTPPPRTGPVLDLSRLSAPGLTAVRERVLDALVTLCADDTDKAAATLGLGASLHDEVTHDAGLRTAPTAPARRVYTGVLYTAAGLARLTAVQRARAAESVRIVSGLWGVVTPEDPIPAYRLSMGTDLPGVGPLATAWRTALAAELDDRADGELVVDCRSAAYLAAWRPPRTAHWVTVRVEQDVDGRRTVVSHHAKHARGVLTRHLLTRRGKAPTDPTSLARAAGELVGGPLVAVELGAPGRGARTLTLVVG